MYSLIEELYPICRSITGNGVRESLRIIARHIALRVSEVPSGTLVFDWTIPKEWNIRDAYIKDEKGQRIVDFQRSNLHVVNYSTPVHETMTLGQLKPHLHTLPDHEHWIPYRTSYYKESWGFCLEHARLTGMKDGVYDVCIDSSLESGHLTYGEALIRGESEEEVFLSSHICHPSLANDNLSGVCMAVALANYLKMEPRRYTYRFVFAPGTIGAITWLARNQETAKRMKYGLILSGVGDAGGISYKRSYGGHETIDRAVEHLLLNSPGKHHVEDFSPYGYDERQYGSPGFRLPVGRISRTPFGTYPEYHTSADNLDFVQPRSLEETFELLKELVQVVETN